MIELTQTEINKFEKTLCQSNFFENDRQLETLFMSKELAFLRNGIPEANTRLERVRMCLHYLLTQNDVSLLVSFLEILRDKHPPSLFSKELNNLIDTSKQLTFTKSSQKIINQLNKNHDLSISPTTQNVITNNGPNALTNIITVTDGGNINIMPNSSEPKKKTIAEIIKIIQSNLDINNYDAAIKLCEKVFEEEFNHPMVDIIYSIALMRGNSVGRLSSKTLKKIEGHLQMVTKEHPYITLSWVVLGLVKHDYYILNRKSMGKPTMAEIKIHTANLNLTRSDWTLINKAKFSSHSFKMLALSTNK